MGSSLSVLLDDILMLNLENKILYSNLGKNHIFFGVDMLIVDVLTCSKSTNKQTINVFSWPYKQYSFQYQVYSKNWNQLQN